MGNPLDGNYRSTAGHIGMSGSQPICILGMHRSGTSVITRLVSLLGAYLGPPDHLFTPSEFNPTRNWENELIVHMNDEILSRLGGRWHEPPVFPQGWEKSPELADLRRRAQDMIREEFGSAKVWAWKDPRVCLTLPFWQGFLAEMKYVICVRNPLDVARSLQKRDAFPIDKSVELWLLYLVSALEHTSGHSRMVVFYEDIMTNWRDELNRLSKFLGMAKETERPDVQHAIEQFVKDELQHYSTSIADTTDERRLAFPVKALYIVLRVYASLTRQDPCPDSVVYKELQEAIDRFARQCAVAQVDLARLRTGEADITNIIGQLRPRGHRYEVDGERPSQVGGELEAPEVLSLVRDLARTKKELAETREELILFRRTVISCSRAIDRLLPEGMMKHQLRKVTAAILKSKSRKQVHREHNLGERG